MSILSSSSNENAWVLVIFFGIGCMLAGLGLQIWHYLQYGIWLPLDVITVGVEFGVIGIDWASSPQSWIGVHTILVFLNAGFVTLMVSVAVAMSIAG